MSVRKAIKRSDIDELTRLHSQSLLETSIIEQAIRLGNIDVLEWIFENSIFERVGNEIAIAIEVGNMNVLEWLIDYDLPFPENACELATRYNHLDILIWMRNIGCSLNSSCVENATRHQNVSMLDYLSAEMNEK